MFCPRCRSEYREGFDHCADCDTELVMALPPAPRPEYVPFEQVLATFNPGDIALIKSLLDAEQIRYYFLGEHFGYVQPLADPARLMVAQDQAEMAREILADFNFSYTGLNVPAKSTDHDV